MVVGPQNVLSWPAPTFTFASCPFPPPPVVAGAPLSDQSLSSSYIIMIPVRSQYDSPPTQSAARPDEEDAEEVNVDLVVVAAQIASSSLVYLFTLVC